MATYTDSGKNFVVATGETVVKGDRVKLSAAGNPPTVAVSGAGEGCIGVALRGAAAGADVAVKLMTDSGTFKVRTAGAVAALAYCYGAAAGEVDDTATGSAQFIALEAASNADEYIEALAVNISSSGESDTGFDFVLYGATAGAEVTFDESADKMIFDGIDLRAQDGDFITFGDADDMTMNWDGTIFEILPKTDDTGAVNIGDGTTDCDFKWFAGATTKTVTFDMGDVLVRFEDVDLEFGDNDQIQFGDATGGDATILWDGTQLEIKPTTDDTGALNIGDGTTDFDFKWFAGDAGDYVLMDVGNKTLDLTDVELIAGDYVLVNVAADTDSGTMTGNETLTAAETATGFITMWTGDPGGSGRNLTTPTAAQIVARFANPKVGSSYIFVVYNEADGAEAITLTAGSGVTLTGDVTVAQNQTGLFLVRFTNVTSSSEAVEMYGIGMLTNGGEAL